MGVEVIPWEGGGDRDYDMKVVVEEATDGCC